MLLDVGLRSSYSFGGTAQDEILFHDQKIWYTIIHVAWRIRQLGGTGLATGLLHKAQGEGPSRDTGGPRCRGMDEVETKTTRATRI